MRTDKHVLNASNCVLSVFNDNNISSWHKFQIVFTVERLVVELYESLEKKETLDVFKEKVISIIEEHNKISSAIVEGENTCKQSGV